jgi:hypothetical protein
VEHVHVQSGGQALGLSEGYSTCGTMMRYAEDATVVLTLEEFITETETELVSLKLGQYRVGLH